MKTSPPHKEAEKGEGGRIPREKTSTTAYHDESNRSLSNKVGQIGKSGEKKEESREERRWG